MQLTSPEVLQALLPIEPRRRPATPVTENRSHETAHATPQPRASRGRCQCGRCPLCADDARWERIFREKFADPTYYRRQTVRQSSSLHGLG